MLEAILTIVIGAILLAILGFFAKKFWLFRPEIKMEIKQQGSSASSREGKRNITLTGILEIYNSSKHDALQLEFMWHPKQPPLEINFKEIYHLESLERRNIKFNYVLDVPLEDFSKDQEKYTEGLLRLLSNYSLILKYRNEMKFTFFSKCTFLEGQSVCSYHWRKPRMS